MLDRATATLGEALPRLGGAVLLLLLGIAVAFVAGRLVRRALQAVGLDPLADRLGIHDVLERVGLRPSLSHLLGTTVRIALIVVAVVGAVSLLGFGALSEALNAVVLFVPKLFVAFALVLAGVVLAQFLGARVDRLAQQMDIAAPLRQLVEVAVIALFALTALAQLGVPTMILTALVGLVLLAAVLTLALAFGLGGRDVARQISAGRYVADAFEVGQRITVGDLTGEIVTFQSAATLLKGADGSTVRVPNQLLIDSIVTVTDAEAAS